MAKNSYLLRVVLAVTLLVSLLFQARAYADPYDDFLAAAAAWNSCNVQASNCFAPGYTNYHSCINSWYSCLSQISWPQAEMEFCPNAINAHTECENERTVCESEGIDPLDCYQPYSECRESSGIEMCQR
jgi:hypothetical protein